MNPIKNLTGQIFNRWTVLSHAGSNKDSRALWEVLCKCGNRSIVKGQNLLNGKSGSCGCFMLDRIRESNSTHGMTGTRIYITWRNMLRRCSNPKDSHYMNYGGRGITVCDAWKTFEGFYKDVGESYLKHVKEFGEKNTTAERLDPNGNYEKSNFKWATYLEQGRTRRDSVISKNIILHKISIKRLGAALATIMQNKIKNSTYCRYFKLSPIELREYIQSLWTEGMSWDNYGWGEGKWVIDHINGCNQFDLSKEEDVKKCYIYTNFQPLWWRENMAKKKFVTKTKEI